MAPQACFVSDGPALRSPGFVESIKNMSLFEFEATLVRCHEHTLLPLLRELAISSAPLHSADE